MTLRYRREIFWTCRFVAGKWPLRESRTHLHLREFSRLPCRSQIWTDPHRTFANPSNLLAYGFVQIKVMAQKTKKLSRRSKALLWLALVSVAVGAMIYFEQIAILYVVATVALVALLVIVGFSNLEKVGRQS